MATYGYDQYGRATYGPSAPTGNYPGSQVTVPVVNTAYILPSILAQPQDYANILVTWGALPPGTMATVTEFRLLASPWGFPVDQNDGTILLDVTGSPPAPGIQYLDTSANPGAVQYYGFYVLSGGVWLRAGFTAALLPAYHGYDVKLMSDLPPYFQNQSLGTVATDIPVAAPGIPATGGSVSNPYAYDVDVWLSAPANVSVNSVPLGQQTFFTIPALGTATLSYAGTVNWQWISRASNPSNTALEDFLSILAYGLDLVKTQYDMKFRSLNDPMKMSLGDLANFCTEIGLPYNSEIPAYAMRKAAQFWGQVMQERGTLGGIAEHITLLSGYPVDVQVSRNFMLDDDQANPADPIWPNWSANVKYQVGETVQYPVAGTWSIVSTYAIGAVVMYNDLFYTCILANSGQAPTNTTYWSQNVTGPYIYVCTSAITTLPGTAPSGSTSANGNWSCLYGGNKNGSEYTATISIPGLSGSAGTWEATNAAGTNLNEAIGVGFPTPQAWAQGAGSPTTGPNGYGNTFRALNNTGSTVTNVWLRSVCRSSADITNSKIVPDPQLVVEHAVPVPMPVGAWNNTTEYQTNTLVTYGNLNYIALRQSTGATPPVPNAVLNQNYDFETTTAPWIANGTTTLASTTTQAYSGTHSMSTSPSGSDAFPGASSELVQIIPGALYSASVLAFQPTVWASGVAVVIVWYDPYGTQLSIVSSSTVVLTANTWTKLSFTSTAPLNATQARLKVQYINTPTAALLTYWDVAELTAIATPEWAPVGPDGHLAITLSGYAIADLGFNPTVSTTVTPFVEWYDDWGNLITRVFARGTSAGSYPANYQYDAFDTGAGFPVAGRTPSNPSSVWSVPAGTWTISSNGNAYAGTTDNDALGVLASPAGGTAAVTVTNPAQSGDDCGVLFWYLNTSNFWVAGLLQLYWVASAVTHTISYTGSAPATGDRIYAEFNNTTSTTNTPDGHTIIGPSVMVYKNSRVQSNILVVVGSGGTATQTAMSSLSGAYLPSTSATSSNAGIASIAV